MGAIASCNGFSTRDFLLQNDFVCHFFVKKISMDFLGGIVIIICVYLWFSFLVRKRRFNRYLILR